LGAEDVVVFCHTKIVAPINDLKGGQRTSGYCPEGRLMPSEQYQKGGNVLKEPSKRPRLDPHKIILLILLLTALGKLVEAVKELIR
jgi:hypothetical protein